MAKRNLVQEAASKNPSVVLRAFAPENEFVCSLDAWIFLEAMGSPFTTGGKPGLGDLVLAALVMTDTDAVIKARRTGKLDELMKTATKGKRPADVIPLTDALAEAINAAFEPSDSGTEAEKKDSAAPDGGSA
jgi:hypothetical protein